MKKSSARPDKSVTFKATWENWNWLRNQPRSIKVKEIINRAIEAARANKH